MSDEPQTEEDAEEEGEVEEKKKPPLLILIGAGVVLLLLIAGAAWFFLFSGGGDSGEDAVAEAKPAYFYDLPTMTVNLASEDDGEQFLKLTVALELDDEAMIEPLELRMPRVLDAFQVYLRELRRSDLEGSKGIYRLKEELRRRVNLAISPARVESILFKEILIQ